MTYDRKCYDLAMLFLESQDLDEQERHKHANTMAQDIQIAIENYMADEFGDEDVLAEQEANYNRMIGESLKR